ncbi:hypothetical protein DSM106972_027120 [Dulcicalothrix desertica PCC 7102]|uniref:Uncharacterized protein n=1 Tax=Dulcicalothrix desertica PCC 7102 TaxID=232991 RepID=A0A3S5K3C2_9CYAN|nr:hypothetical protein [Dulcicalothrix desertica]RUT06455.1 hypothetical protein DSM106972_027120 [Dulcicalothrix desertica PCC 7102]
MLDYLANIKGNLGRYTDTIYSTSSLAVVFGNIFGWLWSGIVTAFYWLGDASKAVIGFLGNLLGWLWSGIVTAFYWLGDVNKAVIGFLGNLLGWLWSGIVTAFYWLGDVSKAVIGFLGNLFNSLNSQPIIPVTCLILIFMLFVIKELLKHKTEDREQQERIAKEDRELQERIAKENRELQEQIAKKDRNQETLNRIGGKIGEEAAKGFFENIVDKMLN